MLDPDCHGFKPLAMPMLPEWKPMTGIAVFVGWPLKSNRQKDPALTEN